jgi:hypothetical protein
MAIARYLKDFGISAQEANISQIKFDSLGVHNAVKNDLGLAEDHHESSQPHSHENWHTYIDELTYTTLDTTVYYRLH